MSDQSSVSEFPSVDSRHLRYGANACRPSLDSGRGARWLLLGAYRHLDIGDFRRWGFSRDIGSSYPSVRSLVWRRVGLHRISSGFRFRSVPLSEIAYHSRRMAEIFEKAREDSAGPLVMPGHVLEAGSSQASIHPT